MGAKQLLAQLFTSFRCAKTSVVFLGEMTRSRLSLLFYKFMKIIHWKRRFFSHSDEAAFRCIFLEFFCCGICLIFGGKILRKMYQITNFEQNILERSQFACVALWEYN